MLVCQPLQSDLAKAGEGHPPPRTTSAGRESAWCPTGCTSTRSLPADGGRIAASGDQVPLNFGALREIDPVHRSQRYEWQDERCHTGRRPGRPGEARADRQDHFDEAENDEQTAARRRFVAGNMRFGCLGSSPLVPHAVLIQAVRIITRSTMA